VLQILYKVYLTYFT